MTLAKLLYFLLFLTTLFGVEVYGRSCRSISDCDRATPICCNGSCISSEFRCIKNIACSSSFNAVCNSTCYNTISKTCFKKQYLCVKGWNLCGTRCYNPQKSYCANPNSRRVCTFDMAYCPEADLCYPPTKLNCCPQEMRLCLVSDSSCCSQSPEVQGTCPQTTPLSCGTQCYSSSRAACYSSQTVCQHGWGFVNNQCYHYAQFYSPDSTRICTTSRLFCPEAYQCYDPRKWFCCAGKGKLCALTDKSCCKGTF